MPNYFLTTLSGVSRRQKMSLKKVVNNFGSSSVFENTNRRQHMRSIQCHSEGVPIGPNCRAMCKYVTDGLITSIMLDERLTTRSCYWRKPLPRGTWSPTRTANVLLHGRGSGEYSSNASIWSESTNAQRSSLVCFEVCSRTKRVFRQTITSAIIPH